MIEPPPEKLEAQIIDMQRSSLYEFLPSLLRRCGGWFAKPCAANPAIALWLQSNALVGRVPELTSEVIRQAVF